MIREITHTTVPVFPFETIWEKTTSLLLRHTGLPAISLWSAIPAVQVNIPQSNTTREVVQVIDNWFCFGRSWDQREIAAVVGHELLLVQSIL